MLLPRSVGVLFIALTVTVMAACSDDDADSPGKQKPDASAVDGGDSHARDAGGKPGHTGGASDAATGDGSTTPVHPHMDGGATTDATAPHPGDDSGAASHDAGGVACDPALLASIELVKKPGTVLLLFDRSFSMADDWNGMPRWQGAGNAVISAVQPLQDLLELGVILFPSETPSPSDTAGTCGVDAFNSTEQLAFQPAEMALQKLQMAAPSGSPNPMYGPIGSNLGTNKNEPIGATPTREALDQANAALASATFNGPAVVILITDGEPNCNWDQTHATDMIAGWRSAYHVDTYVVLLPNIMAGMGGMPSMAIPVGNALAAAGGTTLIRAEDSQALPTAISHTLVQGVKSCSITIDPPAERPDDVQLVVTEHAGGQREVAPHDLGSGSGWTISKDGASVKLTGALCEDAKGGRFDSIELAYVCETLAPVETEPPSCVTAGSAYCHGSCIDVVSDENNCGGCDQKCGAGLTCCGGFCVDTTKDKNSCGACGNVCNNLCCAGECDPNACGRCDNVCSGSKPCCCKDGECYGMSVLGMCDPTC